ncbi:MAG: hypothetical protein ACRDY7_05805 [Acidimicrobiia bacterium]
MADAQKPKDGDEQDLPPVAEAVEEAVESPPRETVSGDPAYAPDAEYAAGEDDASGASR